MKEQNNVSRGTKKNNPILTCKDYTVSHESFDLIYDQEKDMLITTPKPKIEELGKYYESEEYISHTDAKRSLMDKVYQLVKNYTIKQKVVLINSLKTEQKTILDIGCGTGDFLAACKNNAWQITGVEPNKKAREIAYKKFDIDKKKSILLNEDLEQVLSSNKKFDVISMWHVLEHVPNLETYISKLKKLLKPGGTIIIAVPNFKSFDASYYGKYWAAYDVPRHLWHFSKKSIQRLFKKQNLEVVETLPMKFDSYYVSLLSEKYKNKKINYAKAVWIGFQSNLKAKRNFEYSSLIYLIKNPK